jgi:predicted porin
MKKTLVAIAALTLVGAASAQSSVTLYGRIDASIGSEKTTTGGVTTTDIGTQIRSGAHNGSRWGMKGTEDLGGGLKANFVLEQGFSIDNGAAVDGTKQFSRQAFVGLSGGFGSFTVGRQYDLIDVAYGAHDAFGSSGFSPNGALALGTGGDTIVRQDNSVLYSTPNMGGVTGSFMWAPGENKNVVPGVGAGNHYGLSVMYANGPIGLGGTWQNNKANGATSAVTNYMVGGSYDLGVAKLFGQYAGTNNKPVNTKDNGYSLGVVIPLGAPSLMVGYANDKTKLAGAKTQDVTAFSVMGQYPLSKRTYVYAAYRVLETDPVVGATVKTKKMGLGLVHNF